jgi:choline dehydrogenase
VSSNDEILDCIRRAGLTTRHMVGTCNDPLAVVDERQRDHGVSGLRIADAAAMPTIVSGNTSVPCMMICEKCGDMILADAQVRNPKVNDGCAQTPEAELAHASIAYRRAGRR